MVTFQLISEDERYLVYWYYPEGKLDRPHGVITLDKQNGTIDITELAPDDFSWVISVYELNSLRNSVNASRVEEGRPELTEECPSSTEPEVSTFYADHAINKIVKAYKNGERLEKGMAAWY